MISENKVIQAIKNPNHTIIEEYQGPNGPIKFKIKYDPSEYARQNGERLSITANVSGNFIKEMSQ